MQTVDKGNTLGTDILEKGTSDLKTNYGAIGESEEEEVISKPISGPLGPVGGGSEEEESESGNYYQVWKIPYITGFLSSSNLIYDNEFKFEYTQLVTYGTYSSDYDSMTSLSGTIVNQINSNNTKVNYDVVVGSASDIGSYLVKIVFQENLGNSAVENYYYYLPAENGGTSRPTFANENTEPNVSDPNETEEMFVGFDVQYSEAEIAAIQNKWANETFEENFTNFIDTYTNEMYNFSPTSEEVTFRFNKTTPMKEKTQSALAGQAATTTTTVSTSTSVSVSPTTSTSTGTY